MHCAPYVFCGNWECYLDELAQFVPARRAVYHSVATSKANHPNNTTFTKREPWHKHLRFRELWEGELPHGKSRSFSAHLVERRRRGVDGGVRTYTKGRAYPPTMPFQHSLCRTEAWST